MLELKAITVFVACWNIRQLAGQLTPIRWLIRDNDRFYVDGRNYTAEGFLAGRIIYGQGVTVTNETTSYGAHIYNSFCFRGSTDPTKGTWKVEGKVGLRSLTATGSYNLSSKHEKRGYPLIENVTIGEATPVPAICGFVTENITNTRGSTTHIFHSSSRKYIYNYTKEEQVEYMISIAKGSSYIHSFMSIAASSTNGTVYKPACVSSYTRTPSKSWTAKGHIAKATFNASGYYADGFWMLTGLRISTDIGIFAGVYKADDRCAVTNDCVYAIEQNDKNARGYGISGKAYTANGTWEITIPAPILENPSTTANTRQVVKGTFAKDGTFRGHGQAAGFSLSVNGNWGMGCIYTTSHSVSCSENSITFLTAKNYRGCGTASVGFGPFSGGGTYNGTQWNVTGSVVKGAHGLVVTNGTVTYSGKLLTFEQYGDPATGIHFNLVQGGIYHTVYVRQIDTTWVAIGEAQPI